MAKTQKKLLKKIVKNEDVPVTQAQFEAFSAEIKSILTTHKLENRAMEKRTEARFVRLEGRMDGMEKRTEARFVKLENRMDSMEKRLDSKIDGVESRLEAKIDGVEKSLTAQIVQVELSLRASIESLTAAVHRTNAIVEEQNARNKFVIDGYKAVIDVQEDQENRIKKLEKSTFGIET